MGVSIESWRVSIGLFNGGSVFHSYSRQGLHKRKAWYGSGVLTNFMVLIVTINVLLMIGNVEPNPGPNTFETLKDCMGCTFKSKTAEQHIYHQQIHSNTFNFLFQCPFTSCNFSYTSFESVNAHLSHHSIRRDQVLGDAEKFNCNYCDHEIQTNAEYCKHLRDHVKEGFAVRCPLHFDNCSRKEFISSISLYNVHLSQCHPGWRKDYSNSALSGDQQAIPSAVNIISLSQDTGMNGSGSDDDEDLPDQLDITGTTSMSSLSDIATNVFSHDQIIQHIAQFYAKLEGKLLVPESTVNVVAKEIGFLTEIVQDKIKEDLTKSLVAVGIPEKTVHDVIRGVFSMDPLYNAHHKNAPGDCFLTAALRHTYFRKHFKFQEFIEINLRKNPYDTSHFLHYVNVAKTLEILLEDKSVQKIVDESFLRCESDGSVLEDYTDGSVFRSSNCPPKRIDILLFMDMFSCTCALGSAKFKHKYHAVYITLGNLKPYHRSFLKAIRLVMLVNDLSLKGSDRMYKKCFEKLLLDLKNLEQHGIRYKNEIIPVFVQFIQGDNLGQHMLGGFLEGFTATYFCRFCDLTRDMYKEDQLADMPIFRMGNMRTPASFEEDLRVQQERRLESYHGVKRDSPFHKLTHFKVCQPRLPPCIAHDTFIGGIVDRDLSAMIEYFIGSNWFTEEELNMRIRGFKFRGTDARSKPAACFTCDNKKLGGHAIQNWTLLRLLPLLVGDKVKTTNKIWKLYLLLKSVMEMICAPALTREQVEQMRLKINKYMMKRKALITDSEPHKYGYIPKHHYVMHYPDLFLMCGPLVHLWTLCFEHRHQFFKRVARICRNFINLGSLLTSKFQYLQAWQNFGPLFSDEATFSKESPLNMNHFEDQVKRIIQESNFPASALTVQQLFLNELKYTVGRYLLLNESEDSIFVGEIEAIIVNQREYTAIVKVEEAAFWKEYGLYYITAKPPTFTSIPLNDQMRYPCCHPVYEFQERYCFSLKHVFLQQ